jgi:hypothetical protein
MTATIFPSLTPLVLAQPCNADKRFLHGSQTLVSFTWSHAIDQFSEIQAQGGTISSIAPDAHNLDLL